MTRSVFRICQTKRSKPYSMDRPSTAAKHDPPHRTTSSRSADGSTELMSVLQRGDRLVVRELSRPRSVAGCSPRSSAT